jgi:hypothetical protein
LDDNATKKIVDYFKNMEQKAPLYMTYFRHKDAYEGWDKDKHEIPTFRSHIVFHKEPFDKQFIFGVGQENWYNLIVFNHPHSESDVVQVIGWAVDPFLGTAMPLCFLRHSSLAFRDQTMTETEEEFSSQKALVQFAAHQHGIIESQWKKIEDLVEIVRAKLEGLNPIEIARKIADKDMELFKAIFRPVSARLWEKGWFKFLVFVATLVFAAFLVAFILGWIKFW